MDQDFFGAMCRPTMTRPLLGLTVLVVEDSRYACDAMRLMCIRSGARIRRADCLASARRHLAVYRPSTVIVDMGLPDGSGADLLTELRAASPRVSVILATSGDPFVENVAIAAGADGFLAKPLASLAAFQNAILAELPPERRPNGPRSVDTVEIAPDPIAYRDDLAHAADLLDPMPGGAEIDYVARFLSGVARSADDSVLAAAAAELLTARSDGVALAPPVARLRQLLTDRLTERIAI